MAKRWVGDPTTGRWVDDNGNPTTADQPAPAAPSNQNGGNPFGQKSVNSNNQNYGGIGGVGPGAPTPNPSPGGTGGYADWADKAEQELRGFGDQMFGYYTDQGNKAQSYYDPLSQYNANLPANQPKQAQNFYNQHEGDVGPTQNRSQYQDTKNLVNGQVNPVADAYNTNKTYYNNPSHIDENAGAMQAYGTSGTNTQNRYDQRTATGSPTYDASRYDTRLSLGGPTALSDRYGQRQQDTAPEFASGLLGELAGTKSAADGLMMSDPTQTQAVGDLYNNVLMPQEAGPGYAENWYTSTLNGANPYYDRLRQQTGADAERRAAATGTFNAGRSQKLQNDAIAGLDAQQFKDQGGLAAAADASKDSRLAGLSTGAKNYDDAVLGNRKYNLDVANTMDTMTSKNNALRGDLATSADNTNLKFGEDIDSLAGKTNDSWFKQQEDLDALAHNSSTENYNQTKSLDDLSTAADSSNVSKLNTYNTFLNSQDAAAQGKAKDRLTGAQAVDQSNETWQRDLANQANNASQEESNNRDFLAKSAQAASNEGRANLNDQQQSLLSEAAARAGIQLATATQAGGALTEAQMQAINIELQKAGMDQAASADILKAFASILGAPLKLLTGGLLGGGSSGNSDNRSNPNSYFLGDDG